jgi:hypothetical protein
VVGSIEKSKHFHNLPRTRRKSEILKEDFPLLIKMEMLQYGFLLKISDNLSSKVTCRKFCNISLVEQKTTSNLNLFGKGIQQQ